MNVKRWQKRKVPWRIILLACGVCVVLIIPLSYLLWSPGLEIRDGRHDRGQNGIWISSLWLGKGEGWYHRNVDTNKFGHYRSKESIQALASNLRAHHITDVFPKLHPADVGGLVPDVDSAQVEMFLDEFSGFRVIPSIRWGGSAHFRNDKGRKAFIASVKQLLDDHPRFAGVHLNLELLTNGDAGFLKLLDELKASLPPGKLLSIAAYAPPSRWQEKWEVHWDEIYFREVAKRCDQIAVRMYDTSLQAPRLYQNLMAAWTAEVLTWSEGKQVLLGIPTYRVSLRNSLLGIHLGLSRQPVPTNYQGIAIRSDRETDDEEWKYFREHFLK